jgi:hypothetical protein
MKTPGETRLIEDRRHHRSTLLTMVDYYHRLTPDKASTDHTLPDHPADLHCFGVSDHREYGFITTGRPGWLSQERHLLMPVLWLVAHASGSITRTGAGCLEHSSTCSVGSSFSAGSCSGMRLLVRRCGCRRYIRPAHISKPEVKPPPYRRSPMDHLQGAVVPVPFSRALVRLVFTILAAGLL